MTSNSLAQGFADPVMGAQAVFRCVLDAMAQPGRVQDLPDNVPEPPIGINRGLFAVALTLLDYETPVWLDHGLDNPSVADALKFHCGCPLVAEPSDASFALIGDAATVASVGQFHQGTPEFPDRSATLVMAVPELGEGVGRTLSGPGIDGTNRLAVQGLGPSFWIERERACRHFPLGVDIVFATDRSLAALPRTTAVAA